jgi:hypothetical protein
MTAIIISEHHLEKYANYRVKEKIPQALLVPTVQRHMSNELWIIFEIFKIKPLSATVKQPDMLIVSAGDN